MNSWFPLELFPAGGLASSVVTTVWIGVLVVTVLNLRFGTTLSGLVVPGYIVPLLLIKPGSAVVIIVESVVTYLLTRAVAERFLVRVGLGEFFGRDRFFILILVSIIVRVVFDAYLLVALDDVLLLQGIDYEFRSSLHSFGLVIIALSANQFWNSGLKRGLSTLFVHLAITYAILSYILIPYTNFNISTLGYMYEDIASNILASPKAYIILITAAFLSSRLNLRYGWDFNGILIPSLLALQWYNPLKILTTFVEAFFVLFIATRLLRLPMMRNINIEGSRQLLLFFNISFAYKLILAYLVIGLFPNQKITDLYGFGYMLTTLLAIKMYQKNIAIKLTRTTVQTSFMAIVGASAIGFALTLYTPSSTLSVQPIIAEQHIEATDASLTSVIESTRIVNFASESVQRGITLSPLILEQFKETITEIDALGSSPTPEQLDRVAALASNYGYELIWVESRYIVLRDSIPQRGWGYFVFDVEIADRLALQFPTVMDENLTALVIVPLFEQLNAKYLAVASARAKRALDGSDQLLLNSQTLFQVFHQTLSVNNTLQIREYSSSLARELLGQRRSTNIFNEALEETKMWVKVRTPAGLSLAGLEQAVTDIELIWDTPNFQNRQREVSRFGFSELFLTPSSILSILANVSARDEIQTIANEQQITGYLLSFLQENSQFLAPRDSEAYVPPQQSELFYFDQSVLRPLLMLIDQYGSAGWLEESQPLISQIARSADQLGYQIILYKHISTGSEYFILREQANERTEPQRHWGTFVFKLGESSPYVIEAPSTLYEIGSFEFAGSLFQQVNGNTLLISGAHPMANSDGAARLVARSNPISLFNLVHQAVLRHLSDDDAMAVQVRGYSNDTNTGPINQVRLSYFELQKPFAAQQAEFVSLQNYIETLLSRAGVADAAQLIAITPASSTAQARFTRYIPSSQYAEIWLPRSIRSSFSIVDTESGLYRQMLALGIEIEQLDVELTLREQTIATMPSATLMTIRHLLDQFEQSQNIQLIATLQSRFPMIKIGIWQDTESLQSYFLLRNSKDEVIAVKNVAPLSSSVIELAAEQTQVTQAIREFISSRVQWLYREFSQ